MSNEEKKQLSEEIRNTVKELNDKIKKLDLSKLRVSIRQEQSRSLYVNGKVVVSITDTTQI